MASLSERVLLLAPKAPTEAGETHAALVVSTESFDKVQFSADFATLAQLRTGTAPNQWETAWAVFNYIDNLHFYYVAFKTNGWELGKVDPAYPGGQRFLATGNMPIAPVGTQHRFDIATDGSRIDVKLDGVALTTFVDVERPYLSGKIGFYTEDARVAFDNVAGSIRDTFDALPLQSFADGASFGLWEAVYGGYGTVAIELASRLAL